MANQTLVDIAMKTDPRGDPAKIANILAQTNDILLDCQFYEGNMATGHEVAITTGLPEVYFRAINQGIPSSKSTQVNVQEGISIQESLSEVDVEAIRLNGNEAAYRMQEAEHHLEAMNQGQATEMFYGNPMSATGQKRGYLGLTQRYSSLAAGNAQNIIDALGTTTNQLTSVWLVCWGERSIYCIYPKGSQAGLERIDHGLGLSYDTGTTGERLRVMSETFVWRNGLVVHDWRGAVRVANLDTTDFAALSNEMDPKQANIYTDITHRMIQAHARVPRILKARGKMCWYMNSSVHTVLMRVAEEKSSAALALGPAMEQFGRTEQPLTFLGVPIRQVDAILNTESRVV